MPCHAIPCHAHNQRNLLLWPASTGQLLPVPTFAAQLAIRHKHQPIRQASHILLQPAARGSRRTHVNKAARPHVLRLAPG